MLSIQGIATLFNKIYPHHQSSKRIEKNQAAQITKEASKQAFYTIRFLADRDRVEDAFRAYAYFRWVDDLLDTEEGTQQEKKAIINRQRMLLEVCYRGEKPGVASPEEQLLVDLIGNDHENNSGLQLYLYNMMLVMEFDVERRGRLISQIELANYSNVLSTAVTEALFYFICHQDPADCSDCRYQAVRGAHVVHMLRDMVEDIGMGYNNIPREIIESEHISLANLKSKPMRQWVNGRVKLARQYFQVGRNYIANVGSLRRRLAGYTYLARFEWMLRVIEQDRYYLRAEYPERKSFKAGIWIMWRVLTSTLNLAWLDVEQNRSSVLTTQGK